MTDMSHYLEAIDVYKRQYVRYSENMDTWKMSEKSLKTIDITANKRYNRYIKINVLGLVLSTAVTRYGCRG